MVLLTSGVTTSGGFDLRQVGWAESPVTAAATLKQRGLLPDLAGWTVIFSGLGESRGAAARSAAAAANHSGVLLAGHLPRGWRGHVSR